MKKLEKYVGRNVRLKERTFQDLTRRNRRAALNPENCFIVAAVSRGMGQLICYGADTRISVGVGDVVLV